MYISFNYIEDIATLVYIVKKHTKSHGTYNHLPFKWMSQKFKTILKNRTPDLLSAKYKSLIKKNLTMPYLKFANELNIEKRLNEALTESSNNYTSNE